MTAVQISRADGILTVQDMGRPGIPTRNILIYPSPLLTEMRLENQAPSPLPTARNKPTFQITLSLSTKTARAARV